MAILSTIKDFMLYLKESTGYVLYRLSAKCVAMDNGNDLQTEIDTINNNLTYLDGCAIRAESMDNIHQTCFGYTSGIPDTPTGANGYLINIDRSGLILQIFIPYSSADMYIRQYLENNSWTAWIKNLNSNHCGWTLLSKKNNISMYYRYNSIACEVMMEGSLIQADLNAWDSFSFGTLPSSLKPSKTIMIPSCIPGKYMLQIGIDGTVSFVATSTFSGSNDYVSAQAMYFLY